MHEERRKTDVQFRVLVKLLRVVVQQNDVILDLLADDEVQPAQLKALRLTLASHRQALEQVMTTIPTEGVQDGK